MKAQNYPSLEGLDDDTLIYIFSFLTIEEILTARKVSSRLAATSRQLIVWRHALDSQILANGFPFPEIALEGLTALQLEHAVLRAHRLARFWLRPARVPRVLAEFCPRSGTSLSVSDVRLVPAHPGTLVVVSRVIWDTLVLWDVSVPEDDSSGGAAPLQLAEWSRKGALFTGLAVNTDSRSEACLAVSMNFSGDQRIELLAIRRNGAGVVQFETVAAIPSTFRMMTLQGDVVALSDDVNETHLQNWRTGKCVVLCGSDSPSEHNFRHNRCMQVLLTPHCVAIVRARSFETFRTPPLVAPDDIAEPHRPFGQHAFGWIDGVAVTPRKTLPSCTAKSDEDTPHAPPLSILLRAESDDPWADDLHTVDLYVLRPTAHHEPSYPFDITLDAFGNILASGPKNIDTDTHSPYPQKTSIDPHTIDSAQEPESTAPEEDPYTFPPLHVSAYPGTRGHLHCRDMRLGAHGTALWIQPRPAHATTSRGLTAFDVHSSAAQEPGPGSSAFVEGRESLVAAVTAGVMRDNNSVEFGEGVSVRTLRALDSGEGNWTCLDYDEARGIVALGSSHGRVTLLSLG